MVTHSGEKPSLIYYYDVSLSLLGGQLVRNLYIYKYNNVIIRPNARSNTRSNLSLNKINLIIIVNSYKLLNGIVLWS